MGFPVASQRQRALERRRSIVCAVDLEVLGAEITERTHVERVERDGLLQRGDGALMVRGG